MGAVLYSKPGRRYSKLRWGVPNCQGNTSRTHSHIITRRIGTGAGVCFTMDFRANGFPGTNDTVSWDALEYMTREASPNEVIAFWLCALATGYALRAR